MSIIRTWEVALLNPTTKVVAELLSLIACWVALFAWAGMGQAMLG